MKRIWQWAAAAVLLAATAGDFVIPAFDIRTADGQSLHVGAIKLQAH